MDEKKQKYAYWMRPSMVAEIEEMLPTANATSKGDFGCRAVEFYIGYLRQQKNINYLAPMLAGAIKSEVLQFGEKWRRQYPSCVKSWEDNWDVLSTFYEYPPEIRKIIYTTNRVNPKFCVKSI